MQANQLKLTSAWTADIWPHEDAAIQGFTDRQREFDFLHNHGSAKRVCFEHFDEIFLLASGGQTEELIIQSDDYTPLKCSNRSEKMALAWNITAPGAAVDLAFVWHRRSAKPQIRIHAALLPSQLWGQRSPLQQILFYFTGVHIRHANAAALMSLMKHGRPYSWWCEYLITRQMIQQQLDSRGKEIKLWIVPSVITEWP